MKNEILDQLVSFHRLGNHSEVKRLLDGLVQPRAATVPEVQAPPKLTDDQVVAWDKIKKWLASDHSFFVLKGFAGTGKSFLMKMLLDLNYNFIFSAPTNKASKVLSDFLDLPVKTTYSVLGLRMTAEEDKMVLTSSGKLPDLGTNPILVIDEAGTVPAFMAKLLSEACANYGWKILFVGDPAQLNPIGESRSRVWSMAHPDHRAMLREVRRFDNQLLALSIKIRERIKDKDYSPFKLLSDFDSNGGITVLESRRGMLKHLKPLSRDGWDMTKVACWRNRTVDDYNRYIRAGLGLNGAYDVEDRLLMGSPLNRDGEMLAHTDEEVIVSSVDSRIFSYPEGELEAYALGLRDRSFSLYVPKRPELLQSMLTKRANTASQAAGYPRKKLWKDFWELKDLFQTPRYGFALTTHRLQGTTLDNVYIDKPDIMANRNKLEAFRSFYVAATRAQHNIYAY
jgi:exodeoxyribonuclease-5